MKIKSQTLQSPSKAATKCLDHQLHKHVLDLNIEATNNYCRNIKSEEVFLLNSFDSEGNTPLILAIIKNSEDIVDILLQSGANPNQTNSHGNTPLIEAVKNFTPNIIVRLIEEGAKINQTNTHGESPLKIATLLGNQECINLLTEHGACFNKSHHIHHGTESVNSTLKYITSITSALKEVLDNTQNKSAAEFYEMIHIVTGIYLGKTFAQAKNHHNISRVFEQLIEFSKKEMNEKDVTNFARKIIVAVHSEIKPTLILNGDTAAMHLMSKAENLVEEEIMKLKHNEHHSTGQNYTYQKNHKYEKNAQTNDETQEVQSTGMLDIIQEKILCRTANHNVAIIDSITIKPHHPRTLEDAQALLLYTKKRLDYEMSNIKEQKESIESHLKEIDKILKSAKKENRNLTNSEGHFIDQLLRPGKTHRMHIINLQCSDSWKDLEQELSQESMETGATIHCFSYNKIIESKNDLVLVAIGLTNKLLDDGIHPDKIILQGVGEEAEIAKSTAHQFAKRGVQLTQFYLRNNSIIEENNHRQILLTNPLEQKQKNIDILSVFFSNLNKLMKSNSRQFSFMQERETNSISLSQIANLYINQTQDFLRQESKYRNPSLPKERVECIIGITDIDENDLDD